MKRPFCTATALISVFILTTSLAIAQTTAPLDTKKLTSIGKYVNSAEAYHMWKSNPDKVNILDVRTPEEYTFIGHAAAAHNVPSKVWTGKFDPASKDFTLDDNPEFEARVKKLFSPDDTILVMCRSGQRSAVAVNRLAKAGFKNAYNILDGFEGDKVSDKSNPNYGKRMLDGWKNSPAPWTYDLDPKLVYEGN